MRPLMLLLALFTSACTPGLTYKPAPGGQLTPAQTARLTGSVRPWGLYFTAVTQFDGNSARVIVLSEIGLKLLDINVSPSETEVYYKFEKLPATAAGAFGRFARAALLTPCPSQEVTFTDTRTRAAFEASVQGAKICL